MKKSGSVITVMALAIPIFFFNSPNGLAADADRPFFNIPNSNTVDLVRDFPAKPLESMIDERLGVYGGDTFKSTGAYISIRSIFGWGPAVSARPEDGSAYDAAFPPCTRKDQSDCISRVYVVRSDGSIDDALPIKELPPIVEEYGGPALPDYLKTFSGNRKQNLPSGGNIWMWKFKNYKHRGGPLILPSIQFEGFETSKGTGIYGSPIVRIALYPVSVESSVSCVKDEKGNCAYFKSVTGALKSLKDGSILHEKLEGDEKLGLQFRSSIPWTRWSASTVTDVSFKHTMSGGDFVYEILGAPGVIPGVAKSIPFTEENFSALKEIIGPNLNCPANLPISNCQGGIFVGGKDGAGSSDTNYKLVEKLEPLTDKKSTVAIQHWIIQTNINSEEYSQLECVKKFKGTFPAGISSSNATLAQDSPPNWDPNNQSFTYRVAAFSKLPNGETFKGNYSLLIPSDIAKCLWPGNLVNAKLELSILSSNGVSEVATTTTGIGAQWFSFQAAGFHFSSPKLIARVVKSSEQSTPKKVTISCVKGKVTKKVSGSMPKCPAGFKKN